MKVCPKCGKLASYNSYFGAYMCSDCEWFDDSTRTKAENNGDRKYALHLKNNSTINSTRKNNLYEVSRA